MVQWRDISSEGGKAIKYVHMPKQGQRWNDQIWEGLSRAILSEDRVGRL